MGLIDIPEGTPDHIARQIRSLIGCGWGRTIIIASDTEPCMEQAVQMVVLHEGPTERLVKVCDKHLELLTELTDPHKED
jgi:hypothetical protein